MGHGERMLVLDIRTPSSLSLCYFSALASMANYALFYEAADSDLFETLYYKYHKRTGLLPRGSLVTRLLLQPQDLNRNQIEIIILTQKF